MIILWSFSYNSFVEVHGEKIWQLQHDHAIFKFKMRCVMKGLHSTLQAMKVMVRLGDVHAHFSLHCLP